MNWTFQPSTAFGLVKKKINWKLRSVSQWKSRFYLFIAAVHVHQVIFDVHLESSTHLNYFFQPKCKSIYSRMIHFFLHLIRILSRSNIEIYYVENVRLTTCPKSTLHLNQLVLADGGLFCPKISKCLWDIISIVRKFVFDNLISNKNVTIFTAIKTPWHVCLDILSFHRANDGSNEISAKPCSMFMFIIVWFLCHFRI